jgi:hypothetical protein
MTHDRDHRCLEGTCPLCRRDEASVTELSNRWWWRALVAITVLVGLALLVLTGWLPILDIPVE